MNRDYDVIPDSAEMEPNAEIDGKMIESMVGNDICMTETGELIDFSGGGELILSKVNRIEEPYVGMEFESEEAAMLYYDAYATNVGFIVRVGNSHRARRDGSIVSRRFLCNKEGFRVKKKKTKKLEVRKPRQITREGCKAMIMVRKQKSEKWVVTKTETEHSHPLGIPAGKGRRVMVRTRPQDEKDKKIQELSTDLHRANQQLAECRELLEMVLKDVERHSHQLAKSTQNIVENVKEFEPENEV